MEQQRGWSTDCPQPKPTLKWVWMVHRDHGPYGWSMISLGEMLEVIKGYSLSEALWNTFEGLAESCGFLITDWEPVAQKEVPLYLIGLTLKLLSSVHWIVIYGFLIFSTFVLCLE